ncbi:MAG: hypothetical protein FD174_3704 [Geobacteraceae bacterium]|nr:MAG: hypothetical protein FD174_3704 [Geobacteraceae bacterium]
MLMADMEIGCSGFDYPHWRGGFYPEGVPRSKWLEYYRTIFSSVELNVTFYRLPKPETFDKWYGETPSGFVFSLKGSRFITHLKRLRDPAEPLDRFFDAALHLGEKLKVVLWQFPPQFAANLERLSTFLELLARYPVRNTLEFRNASWLAADVVDLCREHNVGLCMADWPEFIDEPPVTADFVYIRRHGHGGDYAGCYSRDELGRDARRIRGYLGEGRDVFIYFNNDAYGFAPQNARELMGMLK